MSNRDRYRKMSDEELVRFLKSIYPNPENYPANHELIDRFTKLFAHLEDGSKHHTRVQDYRPDIIALRDEMNMKREPYSSWRIVSMKLVCELDRNGERWQLKVVFGHGKEGYRSTATRHNWYPGPGRRVSTPQEAVEAAKRKLLDKTWGYYEVSGQA